MGFGMRRRGGARRGRRVGRSRFRSRGRRFGRRRYGRRGNGGAGLVELLLCCFGGCGGSEVEPVGTDGGIHQNVLQLHEQQTYLIQERQMAEQCLQSADPTERAKGEGFRAAEQQRFQAMAVTQKTTYDEAVAIQSSVTEADSARQLTEDITAILNQVQYLQSMGYIYPEGGTPGQGQPAVQQPQ